MWEQIPACHFFYSFSFVFPLKKLISGLKTIHSKMKPLPLLQNLQLTKIKYIFYHFYKRNILSNKPKTESGQILLQFWLHLSQYWAILMHENSGKKFVTAGTPKDSAIYLQPMLRKVFYFGEIKIINNSNKLKQTVWGCHFLIRIFNCI